MRTLFPGAAAQFLERQYGGPLQEAESIVVTGATTVQLVGNDPDAVGLVVFNFGGFDVFMTLTQNPTANSGIRLLANQGGVSLSVIEDFTLPGREWFITSPGGAGNAYVLRLRRITVTNPDFETIQHA